MTQSKHSISLIPILIGLPGAGKSTVGDKLATLCSLKRVSTDELFRVFRAIPYQEEGDSNHPSEVMRRFVHRSQNRFPDKAHQLRDAALRDPENSKGRPLLHDSKLFRSFGEDVFRFFEIVMLEWLVESGELRGALPDLSASAPLFVENQRLFGPETGYLPILLDASEELLVNRLVADYQQHRLESERAGAPVRLRGAYEMAVEAALEAGEVKDEASTIREALRAQSRKDRTARWERYQEFAHAVVVVDEKSPDMLAEEIINLLDQKQNTLRQLNPQQRAS